MTDKNIPWTGEFRLGAGSPTSPAEQAFLRDAERIGEEVAGMSDEAVADYLVEHGLQDLVAPERVETLLALAMEEVRQRREASASKGGSEDADTVMSPFAVRRKDANANDSQRQQTLGGAGNVIRPAFGARRDLTR